MTRGTVRVADTLRGAGSVKVYPSYSSVQSLLPQVGVLPIAMTHDTDPSAQILTALRRGFTFIWMSELYAAMRGQIALPQKPAMFQVDDSRVGGFTVVHPKVVLYGIKANMMVTSGLVDGEAVDASLSGQTGASWAQLRTMRDTGLWEFGNHTRYHHPLAAQDATSRLADLQYCNGRIVSQLGVNPIGIAYPNGSYSADTIADCITAGLKIGFSYDASSNDGTRPSHFGATWGWQRFLTLSAFTYVHDDIIYLWENDMLVGGRNSNNKLGYWIMSAGASFPSPADGQDLRIDNRSVAAAQSTISADYFLVKPSSLIYWYLTGQSELQTAGNAGIRLAQYDITKAFLSNIDLKKFTATTDDTEYEGEATLDPACRFVRVEVWCDAAYTGLVHYKFGQVRHAD